jgi:hypothetical protein
MPDGCGHRVIEPYRLTGQRHLAWGCHRVAARPCSPWLSRGALDKGRHRCGDSPRVWCFLPSRPHRPLKGDSLETSKTRTARSAARRGGDCTVARRHVARHQKGAQEQRQSIFFIAESGFYPLPSVVRTSAPVEQRPILQEWWTRAHLSAISAISPEGKLYFHGQDRAINSADVVAFLEHLPREVPGQMVIIWGGSPIHRSHTSRSSWPTERRHASTWSACRPMLRRRTRARASGNSSKGSSCAMCAVLTSYLCVMSCAPR